MNVSMPGCLLYALKKYHKPRNKDLYYLKFDTLSPK